MLMAQPGPSCLRYWGFCPLALEDVHHWHGSLHPEIGYSSLTTSHSTCLPLRHKKPIITSQTVVRLTSMSFTTGDVFRRRELARGMPTNSCCSGARTLGTFSTTPVSLDCRKRSVASIQMTAVYLARHRETRLLPVLVWTHLINGGTLVRA